MESSSSHWKARFYIAVILLLVSLAGLVITDVSQDLAWNFWRIMIPIYALFSLLLSGYLRYKKEKVTAITIWHELLHWVGLLAAVYITSIMVHVGMMGRFAAALQILTLLSLATFLAGVYIDITFMPIGILLGIFVVVAAVAETYLYSIMIPVVIIAAILIFFLSRKKKKNSSDVQS